MYDTLINTELLAEHIGDPDWVICDCRFVLTMPEAGQTVYAESHIPGAVYFHLDRDLAGPVTPASGRHPLPAADQLAALLGRAGINANTQIVAYDDMNGAIAARLWWLARWLGHHRIAVLDGGWQAWLAEHRLVNADIVEPGPQHFVSHCDDTRWVTSHEVLAVVSGHKPGRILDARAADRFRGENESLDPVAGHVPGAVNLPFTENVETGGRFHNLAELRIRFEAVLGDTPSEQVICMCGSGVTACHNLLAMELAGLKGARLYAGSWSEWIRDTERPVIRGT
jgi:thiosulfate/3-mercaptopyruvate sulfurtransferase